MSRSPLMDAAFGYMQAQIVHVAAELGLADALAGGPLSSAELAKETGAHAPSLHRLLRALTCLGAVEQREQDLFALTGEGSRLRSDAPDSIRSLVMLFCGPDVWRTWGDMAETLRTGEYAWLRVTGKTPFESFAADTELSATFNKAMAEHTRTVAPGLIKAHDFSRYGTVADLGGGDGTLLAAILETDPELRGILYDLPAGLKAAAGTLSGVADRCEVVEGDFFEAVPEGADAYILKSVIHDWDDEKAAAILRTVRQGMRPDARVLLLEQVVPEMVEPGTMGTVMNDLNMLVATGGRERTAEEYRDLLAVAGLTVVADTGPVPPSDYHVIEARPAD
ncbi:helix-turn-helix domain-containing protein [Actinomadura graeca]|uniref:Helix-turn-helix domain-containing protein n=1 Tax=Actinomadura graeca TaxID=2750812 RepID=A0ABX8R4Q7_9ACTN|nr:acetylserotonin O-methyltransferase [Actinomadura graeca]QXJ26056.1 helix-turn-helix domain-containing protein [Actinomadura graeca]